MPVIERVGKSSPDKQPRTWKRKLLIGAGYLTFLLGGIVLIVLKLTSPLVERFDTFLNSARNGRTSEAYALMSNGYRAATPADAFASFLAQSSMAETSKVNWSSRSIKGVSDGATGSLLGTITLRNGTVVPLRVQFVRELGAWRIHTIERNPTAGASNATGESR